MLNKSLFKISLLIIIAVNILSFLAYHSPILNWLCFMLILIIAAVIAWRNLFYGLLLILGELMISSQGHLFDLWFGNFRFSLRMGLFLIILIVALIKFSIFNFQFSNNFSISQFLNFSISKLCRLIKEYKFYFLFALFIIFGITNGLFNRNNLNFLYQDVNGYFFFLLLPIFITALKNQKVPIYKFQVISLWSAAIVWQFIIAASLLFLYSHLDIFWRGLVPVYSWFRDQRLVEVGVYKYNFYRVFMQSGIWVLTGFFVFLYRWIFSTNKEKIENYEIEKTASGVQKNKKISQYLNISISSWLIFIITILIISLSRSFWLAGLLTFIAFIIFYLYSKRPKIKILLSQSINLMIILIASFAIIAFVLLIPIGQIPGLKSLTALSDRTLTTEDAAIASRWDLLPALWKKIKPDFFLGCGFGAAVTYKTSDPRYLEAHPDNPYYTAFAFEWGWFDIWYKMGLLGLLTYLLLLFNILKRGCGIMSKVKSQKSKISNIFAAGLFFGLIALMIVHFFTPFLNHPLGIGYLLLADAVFRTTK